MEAAASMEEGGSAAEGACVPAAVGSMVGEAAAFMEEEASPAEGACAPAVAAGSEAGRLRRPLQVIEVQVLRRAQAASSHRGQAATILDRVVISREEISGLEIPIRLPVRSPTADGTPLEVQPVAADLRALHRNRGPQVTQEASTYLAGIAGPDLPGQFAAFRARVAKSMRMLP